MKIIRFLCLLTVSAILFCGCANITDVQLPDNTSSIENKYGDSPEAGNGATSSAEKEAAPDGPGDPNAEATSAVTAYVTEAGETSAYPEQTTSGGAELPSFTGNKVRILAWADSEYLEFNPETLTGEVVNDAVITRNSAVESRLGVEMVWTFERGSGATVDSAPWNEKLVKAVQAQEDNYDAIAAHSKTIALNAYSGVCADLLVGDAFPYLELEQTWWPASLTEDASIGGRLFFLTGDIAQSFSEKLMLCFANEEMLANAGVTDIFATVLDGEWTFERFTELCATVDRGHGGNADEANDRFGYIGYFSDFDPWLYAAGMKLYSSDADGKLSLAVSVSDLPVINTLDMLKTLLNGRSGWKASTAGKALSAFASGRSLFMTGTLDTVKKFARLESYSDSLKLVHLPMPKYNRDTADYRTCLEAYFTMYAVPVTAPDRAMVSAFLECMANEGYLKITPAVFETDFLYRYDGSSPQRDMFDIIKEGAVLDPGRIFSSQLESTSLFFRNSAGEDPQYNWAAPLTSKRQLLGKLADKLSSALASAKG